MTNEHGEVDIEGKPIDDFFEVNILKAYQKVLTRFVDEGTNLTSHNGQILNSKTDWHQPKIIRNIIIQGGAETVRVPEGRRPSPPPLADQVPATLVSNVETPSQTGESARSIRGRHREERARGQ